MIMSMNFKYVRDTAVGAMSSLLIVAPAYYLASELGSNWGDNVIYFETAACAPANVDPLAELCKHLSEVDSDAFYAALCCLDSYSIGPYG